MLLALHDFCNYLIMKKRFFCTCGECGHSSV